MLALGSHVSWLACLAHAASFVFKERFRFLVCLDNCFDDASLVKRVGAAAQLPHERRRGRRAPGESCARSPLDSGGQRARACHEVEAVHGGGEPTES